MGGKLDREENLGEAICNDFIYFFQRGLPYGDQGGSSSKDPLSKGVSFERHINYRGTGRYVFCMCLILKLRLRPLYPKQGLYESADLRLRSVLMYLIFSFYYLYIISLRKYWKL